METGERVEDEQSLKKTPEKRRARVLAFQALYAWEAGKARFKPPAEKQEILENLLDFPWLSEEENASISEEIKLSARLFITGAADNLETIDKNIKAHLEHWDFSRLRRIDLAVLRLGAYQLLYQRDMPVALVISESVAVVKTFGEEKSCGFVNGVLDAIRKTVENE